MERRARHSHHRLGTGRDRGGVPPGRARAAGHVVEAGPSIIDPPGSHFRNQARFRQDPDSFFAAIAPYFSPVAGDLPGAADLALAGGQGVIWTNNCPRAAGFERWDAMTPDAVGAELRGGGGSASGGARPDRGVAHRACGCRSVCRTCWPPRGAPSAGCRCAAACSRTAPGPFQRAVGHARGGGAGRARAHRAPLRPARDAPSPSRRSGDRRRSRRAGRSSRAHRSRRSCWSPAARSAPHACCIARASGRMRWGGASRSTPCCSARSFSQPEHVPSSRREGPRAAPVDRADGGFAVALAGAARHLPATGRRGRSTIRTACWSFRLSCRWSSATRTPSSWQDGERCLLRLLGARPGAHGRHGGGRAAARRASRAVAARLRAGLAAARHRAT